MGILGKFFGGRSLETLLARARRRLAEGDFEEAHRVVEEALLRYPEAEALRETDLTIRRARARRQIQGLKDRIHADRDPQAYEDLVQLYLEVDLAEEALREARAYAAAHPDRDVPHVLLGEMMLRSFFDDFLARDAHAAHDHLLRAARLNAQAVKPRVLLAELYYGVGADRALHTVGVALEPFAAEDPSLQPVLDAVRSCARPDGTESVDGLFEKVELTGSLVREATAWPARVRRNRDVRMTQERSRLAAASLVEQGGADEVVILRRGGALVAHAPSDGTFPEEGEGEEAAAPVEARGLVAVAQAVARTVAPRARDFDLGGFRRCSIQGPFGVLVVGEVAGLLVGARARTGEAPRLWERLSVRLAGERRGA